MTNYVAGFLFSQDLKRVALIRKAKPDWQAGLLNGIGGKIEDGETRFRAMVREFAEETGATVTDWEMFAEMVVPRFAQVAFFTARGDYRLQDTTDEKVDWYPADDQIRGYKAIPNLDWLVPMALLKFTAPHWHEHSQITVH